MTQLSGTPSLEATMEAGDLAKLMAAFNDVTARLHETHDRLHQEVHRLRSELADANEQLERSRRLAALGQMAAGIAHEVRNPLGSIGLYARMLEEDLSAKPDQQAVATKIARAVVGLNGVVGDVLTFARELTVRPTLVDSTDLFERAIESALPEHARGLIEVRIGSDASEAIALRCDAALIQQALVNLIRNAGEAMRETDAPGATLSLQAERVDSPGRARPTVVLRVIDTGPGMGRDVIERMFNPFFTTRHTGTGLGLAIVHRIVDAHGGHIVVDSCTGADAGVDSRPRGTTIELHLPQPGGDHSELDPARTAGD